MKAPGMRTISYSEPHVLLDATASKWTLNQRDPYQTPGDSASQTHHLEIYPAVLVASLPAAATKPPGQQRCSGVKWGSAMQWLLLLASPSADLS